MNEEYSRCFELLQNEFIAQPMFTSLLYAFGRYAVNAASKDNNYMFLGAAIGALEECIRS